MSSSPVVTGGEPPNPYSFLNFLTTENDNPELILKTRSGTSTPNNGKSIHRNTPAVEKSPCHMSMREMRETLEALRTRNNELELTNTKTELLEVEVQELTSRLEVTEADLTKTRKKCKKLSLELSENRFKEEQETVDLDRMVKKVEEKLERSEIRAAAAEAELARVKAGVNTHDIEKLAWQLNQTADNAHLLVKQLCGSLNGGVEELRVLAKSAQQMNNGSGSNSRLDVVDLGF